MLLSPGRLTGVHAVGVAAPAGPMDIAVSSVLFATGLRALSKSYAKNGGPFADVRRSTDGASHTCYSMRNGKFSQSDLTTFLGSASGTISRMYDQGPYADHAIQATLANQPQIANAGSINMSGGLPTAKFASNELISPLLLSALSNNCIINAVLNPSSFVAYSSPIYFRGGSGSSSGFQETGSSVWGYNWSDYAPNYNWTGGPSLLIGNAQTLSLLIGASITQIARNGTVTSPPNQGNGVPTNNSTSLAIGSDPGNFPSRAFTGSISEVLILSSSSTTIRHSVEQNQGAFYGISVS